MPAGRNDCNPDCSHYDQLPGCQSCICQSFWPVWKWNDGPGTFLSISYMEVSFEPLVVRHW